MSNQYVEIVLSTEKDSWKKEVLESPVPVIVDFYADWCGPCKQLAPKIEEKLHSLKTFKLVKVNVDDHGELAEEMEVSGIPAVFLFKNGEKVMSFTGNNTQKLEEMVNATKK